MTRGDFCEALPNGTVARRHSSSLVTAGHCCSRLVTALVGLRANPWHDVVKTVTDETSAGALLRHRDIPD